jgi:hypothetical protein
MIGGIILLVVFIAALVFMLTLGQQYDVYQTTAAAMQQRQIDMYSENLLAAYPGITNGAGAPDPVPPATPTRFQVSCGIDPQKCNNYTLVINNLGINSRITRIYISSDTVCSSCVMDPSNTAAPNHFLATDALVNAGESSHYVVFWLKASDDLSYCTNDSECRVSVVTARGRVFSFLWPFPTIPTETGGQGGGTGIYIGPLVITFQKALITYTTNTHPTPTIPLGGQNGYWVLQSAPNKGIIVYIKIQTDVGVGHDVYLTPQTVFEIFQFNNPGAVNQFFTVAPISQSFCNDFYDATYNPDIICTLSTYTGPGAHTTSGDPTNFVAYPSCNNPPLTYNECEGRYIIPKPTAAQNETHSKGSPVIVAFALAAPGGPTQNLQWKNVAVTSLLGLSYVYDNGDGPYLYGVTLPFITLCIGDTSNPPVGCSM